MSYESWLLLLTLVICIAKLLFETIVSYVTNKINNHQHEKTSLVYAPVP